MDKDLVARKLDSLVRCLSRIEDKRPPSAAILASDIDCQDILSINLERAVQLCVDLGAYLLADTDTPPPETMGDVFRLLADRNMIEAPVADALRKAVGFRNLSVHAYDRPVTHPSGAIAQRATAALLSHRLTAAPQRQPTCPPTCPP